MTQEQVTQADRDAAADFYCDWFQTGDLNERADLIVQAFARHRLTHTEPQDASRPSEGLAQADSDHTRLRYIAEILSRHAQKFPVPGHMEAHADFLRSIARHRLAHTELANPRFTALRTQEAVEAARQALSEYREAPFRSADWLAGRMMDIFDSNNTKGDGLWSTTAASTSDAHERLAELLKKVGEADLTSLEFRVAKNDLADFVICNSASLLAALSEQPRTDAAALRKLDQALGETDE